MQDLRYGVRTLRRSPRFSVAVVLVLGFGVALTTTVFAIVDSLLLNAVPFAEPHRLVELHRWGPSGGGPSQPVTMVANWRNERALFERVETYARVEGVFASGGEPETLQGARVSPGMFTLLGIAPGLGRAFAPDEAGSPVAIVSHGAWQTRFGGDADIVGRPLRLGERVLTRGALDGRSDSRPLLRPSLGGATRGNGVAFTKRGRGQYIAPPAEPPRIPHRLRGRRTVRSR